MAMKKLYDLAVKTSSYTDRNTGQEKGRYENVGAVMQGDDGNKFLMFKRTFNPAGVPNPESRDTLIVSMFAPREQQGQQNHQPPARPQAESLPSGGDPYSEDIPFASFHKGAEFVI